MSWKQPVTLVICHLTFQSCNFASIAPIIPIIRFSSCLCIFTVRFCTFLYPTAFSIITINISVILYIIPYPMHKCQALMLFTVPVYSSMYSFSYYWNSLLFFASRFFSVRMALIFIYIWYNIGGYLSWIINTWCLFQHDSRRAGRR